MVRRCGRITGCLAKMPLVRVWPEMPFSERALILSSAGLVFVALLSVFDLAERINAVARLNRLDARLNRLDAQALSLEASANIDQQETPEP